MASLNRVMIIGGLGRDPEVTYTQAGKAVCKLSIATSESWTDKSTGEKRENTEWHRAVAFDKQAETLGRYLSKGSQIYIEGQLKTSKYSKDGIDRYSTDVIIKTFQFIGSKNDNPGSQQGQQQNQPQNQQGGGFQSQQQTGGFQGPPDDDIPF